MNDINILLIIALIFIFLIAIMYLEKNNLCDQGLCTLYDNYFFSSTNYIIYFLISITMLLLIITHLNTKIKLF